MCGLMNFLCQYAGMCQSACFAFVLLCVSICKLGMVVRRSTGRRCSCALMFEQNGQLLSSVGLQQDQMM